MSAIYNDINTNLVVGCGGCNKQLSIAHLNLIWSPVAFVDLGIEVRLGSPHHSPKLQGQLLHSPGRYARQILATDTKVADCREPPMALPADLDITDARLSAVDVNWRSSP